MTDEELEAKRQKEFRESTIARLATVLFVASAAGPTPRSPHQVIQLSKSFLDAVEKEFGADASRRIF